MKKFSKQEKKIVKGVLLFIVIISLFNFRIALRKARDFQRKHDINRIVDALEVYHDEFGFYPFSSDDGKLIACKRENVSIEEVNDGKTLDFKESIFKLFRECEWGQEGLKDVSDPEHPPYIEVLPTDPNSKKGVSYQYVSNSTYFQVFGALEGKNEPEYREKVEMRNISCGKKVCNFGKSLNNVPLEESIEEFMNK